MSFEHHPLIRIITYFFFNQSIQDFIQSWHQIGNKESKNYKRIEMKKEPGYLITLSLEKKIAIFIFGIKFYQIETMKN